MAWLPRHDEVDHWDLRDLVSGAPESGIRFLGLWCHNEDLLYRKSCTKQNISRSVYKTKHFKESEVIRDLAYSVRVDRHCERLSTSLLPVGLQHSKALCQTHGKSLEVLKSEPTNTEHRGEETCPGSECRLEGQLAQMPLALYVLIACTVRQDCLRALT